ncbi:MAG TPA: NAD(P)H-binding protein [Pedococcus sp.]|jgi:uncharacterized protein YbjT (DUF2867 family)|nr:NAD(P)H-binding protein [Pedococcus sp.]
MITVVGGTGRLGQLVVASLLAKRNTVRVVSRHATSRGLEMDPRFTGVQLLDVDVANADQVPSAIAGSTHVVAAMTGMDPRTGGGPRAIDRDGAIGLIDAAAEIGCHLVLVSIVGAAPDSPIELFRAKWAAESHLRTTARSGTIVRATAFAELWADILSGSAGRDGRARLFGPAGNPINFVPVADVAAAVVRAVEEPAMAGQCVEVGGPDTLSLTELAARLTGRAPRHLPTPLVHAVALGARPFAPGVARIARQALAMERVDLAFTATT